MDPILQQHVIMNGEAPPPMSGAEHFPMPMFDDENISRQVPVVLAGVLIGSIGALIFFRMAGFRFVFGANVGG